MADNKIVEEAGVGLLKVAKGFVIAIAVVVGLKIAEYGIGIALDVVREGLNVIVGLL